MLFEFRRAGRLAEFDNSLLHARPEHRLNVDAVASYVGRRHESIACGELILSIIEILAVAIDAHGEQVERGLMLHHFPRTGLTTGDDKAVNKFNSQHFNRRRRIDQRASLPDFST